MMNTVIEGVLARVQRDNKLTLCHYLWMGNHAHLLFVMRDAEQCSNFLSELQKQVTEVLKRLLGISHLALWEGSPSVMVILDLEKAKERISYFYCNPARAGLVESIEDYPGISSWRAFNEAVATECDTCVSREVPWIQPRAIAPIPGRTLSEKQDNFITAKLIKAARRRHYLRLYPNAFMRAFKIQSPQEVQAINQSILFDIRRHEVGYVREREAQGRRTLGKARLRTTPILAPHRPSPRSRRVYVLSSLPELRTGFILKIKWLNGRCRELYALLKAGHTVAWPLGVFPPRCPPLANALLE